MRRFGWSFDSIAAFVNCEVSTLSFGRETGSGGARSSRDTGDRGGNWTLEDDASALTRRTVTLVCGWYLGWGRR